MSSGMTAFVHGAAATPTPLLDALAARSDLEGVNLYHLHTGGPAPFVAPECRGRLRSVSVFAGPPVRDAIERGDADFIPIFLSDIPSLFLDAADPARRRAAAAVAARRARLLHARHVGGRRARRVAVGALRHRRDQRPDAAHARQHAGAAVARSTRSFTRSGRCRAHDSRPPSPVEEAIGATWRALVEDGATLQMGIGAIPDAVLRRLRDKQDLGIHTEMFSDGVVDLVETGAITNRRKHVHRGRIVTSFVDRQPARLRLRRRQPVRRVPPLRSDQRHVDHPDERQGHRDQLRARDRSVRPGRAPTRSASGSTAASAGRWTSSAAPRCREGGKPIIALPSTAAGGTVSRIVPSLKPGAGVVTTRGHVHWVVTEYGAVNLFGLSLRQRAEALIRIAHPDVRGDLRRAFAETRHITL